MNERIQNSYEIEAVFKKTLKAFLESQSKIKFYLFFANNFKEGF